MPKLINLKLDEFSIVRGSDYQPANPEALALRYKAEPKHEEHDMQKAVETPAAEKQKSLAGRIADAVNDVIGKATQTRTAVSTYQSESRTTETMDDGGAPAAGGSVTVVVAESVEKPAPDEPAEDIATAVAKGVEPLAKAVLALDGRVAALEKRSIGSRQVSQAAPRITVEDDSKFPEFAKFLAAQSGLTPGQKLTKATISTSGWSYGLTVEEATNFINYIVDQSTLLKRIRTVQMAGHTKNIDKIGLGSNVLVKGTPGIDPGDTVSLSGPTQVQLVSQEIVAIVSVGDDTLEDNIEGDAFIQTLLGMIARAAANEIEQAAIHGDTSVADTGILDRWDGWLKLAIAGGAHVTEAMADTDRYWPGGNGTKATKLLKSLPTKYRQDLRNLAWILHSDLYLDYNDELASKGYGEAFASITGIRDVPLRGIQNVQVPLMKTDIAFTYNSTPYTDGTVVMLTDLRNLIWGIQRDIRIEPFRQPRKRATDYVLSMRAAVQIENADAVAIYNHAKVKA